MELAKAVDFARTTTKSVLTTLKRDGRPQLSNVLHSVTPDGVVRISVTADRAKYVNLAREPWAALHVTQDDFWAYVVLEGDVELSAIAAAPDDAVVDELAEMYAAVLGDLKPGFRETQVSENRVVVRLRPTRAYGMLALPR